MFSATKKSQKSSAQNSSGFGHFFDASRGELHSRRYFNTYHLFLQAGCLEYNSKCYLSLTYFQPTCFFCREAPRPCTPGILSCRRKVKLRLTTKDSQGTSWFLDLQQVPIGESSFARFSGAMTTKVIPAETKTLPCPLSIPPAENQACRDFRGQ